MNESLNKFARNFKLDEPPQLKNQPDNPSPQPPIESEMNLNNLQLTTTITTITKPTTTLIYLRQTVLLTNASSFRLWAEVFHVSASGAGTVKWQQVSEDLVPVNITCIQDSPECIFHITAYNSQVDKILDVRLVQPGEKLQTPLPVLSLPFSYATLLFGTNWNLCGLTGTRIGQASECFVYWKDPMTNDTWGLNFTSPIDAKQFRECCVSILLQFVLHSVHTRRRQATTSTDTSTTKKKKKK